MGSPGVNVHGNGTLQTAGRNFSFEAARGPLIAFVLPVGAAFALIGVGLLLMQNWAAGQPLLTLIVISAMLLSLLPPGHKASDVEIGPAISGLTIWGIWYLTWRAVKAAVIRHG